MVNLFELNFFTKVICKYLDVKQIKHITNCNKSLNNLVIPSLFKEIINKYNNNWVEISAALVINQSVAFIRQYKTLICWDFGIWDNGHNTPSYKNISIEFIREFQDKVDWWEISCLQLLNEDLIREFRNRVCWKAISYHQKLSEKIIREFKDNVYWDFIFERIILSKSFIIEFIDKVNWNTIHKYHSTNKDIIFACTK